MVKTGVTKGGYKYKEYNKPYTDVVEVKKHGKRPAGEKTVRKQVVDVYFGMFKSGHKPDARSFNVMQEDIDHFPPHLDWDVGEHEEVEQEAVDLHDVGLLLGSLPLATCRGGSLLSIVVFVVQEMYIQAGGGLRPW